MEQVTGIEPASPAWKAGALTIVLHLHAPSVEIVSFVRISWKLPAVKRFRKVLAANFRKTMAKNVAFIIGNSHHVRII